MVQNKKKTLGLALSGSGNRTSFYIGFLEVLQENNIQVDYISACSGGSLVASAFACDTLGSLKDLVFKMTQKDLRQILTRKRGVGGLYSLDYMEEQLSEKITKGHNFDEVKPKMSFTSVDVNNGEVVELCMGDIAHAARISCTTPALFEPVTWGNRVLVDGGVLSVVPVASLKKFNPDVIIGIDIAQTPYIFTSMQMSIKKAFNFLYKNLFLSTIINSIKDILPEDDSADYETTPKLFSVWGRSLDLAMYANNRYADRDKCDIKIKPNLNKIKVTSFGPTSNKIFYNLGRDEAQKQLAKIKLLLA